MNRFLAERLDQLFEDFERPARMLLQRHGLNSISETKCLAEWLERRLRLIRGEGSPISLNHQAFG
jgi:hypothetical protein